MKRTVSLLFLIVFSSLCINAQDSVNEYRIYYISSGNVRIGPAGTPYEKMGVYGQNDIFTIGEGKHVIMFEKPGQCIRFGDLRTREQFTLSEKDYVGHYESVMSFISAHHLRSKGSDDKIYTLADTMFVAGLEKGSRMKIGDLVTDLPFDGEKGSFITKDMLPDSKEMDILLLSPDGSEFAYPFTLIVR